MTFRELHKPGTPFVLANAWDIGSAKVLEQMGAKAIATSSAAFAFTRGLPDGGKLDRDAHLTHAQELISAVKIPVSGDFEDGFGPNPEDCAETVRLSGEIGLAGICIEDTIEATDKTYEFDLAVERIRAASAAARALKSDFFLVARADGWMTRGYDLEEAIRRIEAFDEAGADGLYIPLLRDADAVRRVVGATKKPVNVLAVGNMADISLAEFAELGVARVSLGSALARATHRTLIEGAEAILGAGNFSPLKTAYPGDKVDTLLLS